MCQQAYADARDMGLTGQGDDGDAHPEGFARGGGSVIWKCVEGDVDVVIGAQMFPGDGEARHQFDAVPGDAVRFKLAPEPLLNRWG